MACGIVYLEPNSWKVVIVMALRVCVFAYGAGEEYSALDRGKFTPISGQSTVLGRSKIMQKSKRKDKRFVVIPDHF